MPQEGYRPMVRTYSRKNERFQVPTRSKDIIRDKKAIESFGNMMNPSSFIVPGEEARGWEKVNKGFVGNGIFEGMIFRGEGSQTCFLFL